MSKVHFVLVSEQAEEIARAAELAHLYDFTFESYSRFSEYEPMLMNHDQLRMFMISAGIQTDWSQVSQDILKIKKHFRSVFVCLLLESLPNKSSLSDLKKSGVSLIQFKKDFIETSRLEFIVSQVIRSSFIPVKVAEFKADIVLDFNLYHLMPLNEKILPVFTKGTKLEQHKIDKFSGVKELFVHRDELSLYQHYIETHSDNSTMAIANRCRAKYLSLCSGFAQLVFLLLDRDPQVSEDELKWLYDRCQVLCKDVLTSLVSLADPWDVLNASSVGEFGSVERSPTIACYAGMMSLLASIEEPIEIMMASALADIGMLSLSPQINHKLRIDHGVVNLSFDETHQYINHPVESIKIYEDKGLHIAADIKNIILNTHERIDATGFPYQPRADKIPYGAMLIQLAEILDQQSLIRMGKQRESAAEVRKSVVEEQIQLANVFSEELLKKIRTVIV